MVSEKTIYRMLEKSMLPAVRVGNQWRFRRKDIDSWIDRQVQKVEIEGDCRVLVELEQSEIRIAPLMEEDNVWLDVPALTRDELIVWMIQNARLEEGVDREALAESVRFREQLCSTALVDRAAFPHPNDPAKFRFSRKRVLFAILRDPVPYMDPHGHEPRIIAMVLARTIQGYLLAISRAIKLFGDPELVDRLIACKEKAEVIRMIGEAEKKLETRS